jgi:hypothetical protein
MKVGALARLLMQVQGDVPVRCVTRWRIDEIAVGVSDLGVWPLIHNRPAASLWLRSDLHAKHYRADDDCLVGSANLTGAALGWSKQPNLELLVPVPSETLRSFEAELFRACIQVNADLYNHTLEAVELVRRYIPMPPPFEEIAVVAASNDEELQPARHENWVPTLSEPADLYLAYSGRGHELNAASRASAELDLLELPVVTGMPRDGFEACIAVLLLQKPIVRTVDEFLAEPQRFGAVRNLLRTLSCNDQPGFDATYAWQTLMRWLFHFMPTRYKRVPSRHSQVVVRSDQ